MGLPDPSALCSQCDPEFPDHVAHNILSAFRGSLRGTSLLTLTRRACESFFGS